MHLLSVENLTKHIGEKTLFAGANFHLSPGERIGILGVNGSGKSTLLRILMGVDTPDGGEISRNPKTRFAYLPQDPAMDSGQTVLNYIFAGDAPTMQLLRTYEQTVLALERSPNDPTLQQQLTQLSQRMTLEGGWEAEAQAKAILTRLGLQDFSATIDTLSGGQRRRLALARALLDPADLLILDEPTNHLDPDTVDWLEEHLQGLKSALLLVTHDRYFLDNLVDSIFEIAEMQIFRHPGNYSDYLQNQADRQQQNEKRELDRRSLVAKELDWLRRSPMARGGKQKARIQRAEALLETQHVHTQNKLDIRTATRRTGKRIVELHNLHKGFNNQTVINNFSYIINKGDRLGIVGPNGSGKTTLLNLITGRLEPDQGHVIIGETIHIGYYDQESLNLDENQRVLDYIAETADVIQTATGEQITAAHMLERFMFSRRTQWNYISSLSGGERRRLYLLRTLMLAPNVLILDEPTNDLDVQTLTVLEDYLDQFEGVLLVVSHDRYFLDRTVEHIFAFEGDGRINMYPGNYSVYRQKRAEQEAARQAQTEAARPRAASAPPPKANRPRRLTYREKQELGELENRIATLEAEQSDLSGEINHVGSDYQELSRLSSRLTEIETELDQALERWTELAELAE